MANRTAPVPNTTAPVVSTTTPGPNTTTPGPNTVPFKDVGPWPWDLGQTTVSFVAQNVCIAYRAFKNWQGAASNKLPIENVDKAGVDRATQAIVDAIAQLRAEKKINADFQLTNIVPIFIYEGFPNGRPDIAKIPFYQINTYTAGYQLFGFAATQVDPKNGNQRNICAFRGTVTVSETSASLGLDFGQWKAVKDVMLPRVLPIDSTTNGTTNNNSVPPANSTTSILNGSSIRVLSPQTVYGKVKESYWNWYAQGNTSDPSTTFKSLADSVQTAIIAVKGMTTPTIPWLFTGHSFGGGLITLAALDAGAQSRLIAPPSVITFGSVLVGDQKFADAYNRAISTHIRIENTCDPVPTLQGLAPNENDETDMSYTFVPVGKPWYFVRQRYALWGNHNITAVYLAAVSEAAFDKINQNGDALVFPARVMN